MVVGFVGLCFFFRVGWVDFPRLGDGLWVPRGDWGSVDGYRFWITLPFAPYVPLVGERL